MIDIRSASEIDIMREGGAILARVMKEVGEQVASGITTRELDRLAARMISQYGATASFKGYGGFPGSICASINEQVVHGIPDGTRLQEGDIVGIDIGVYYKGFHTDMARTFAVGDIGEDAKKVILASEESFKAGMEFIKEGFRVGDVGYAIQRKAEEMGCTVVRELTGHGVGRNLHEDPEVPNYGRPGYGKRLWNGMVLAVEPMVNAGVKEVIFKDDGWTVVTADGRMSGHYENTVAVTPEGPLIITAEPGEEQPWIFSR
ncbi:MAG: type I methionyl aminopeptidase [Christensenellales bacterium]|jgi:methionyl aminopeptidase